MHWNDLLRRFYSSFTLCIICLVPLGQAGILFGSVQNASFGLRKLEEQIKKDLASIEIPSSPWIICSEHSEDVLDVAIIGGGMAGFSTAFALQRLGINHISIFDENPKGYSGPWRRTARMETLRSGKKSLGTALHIPCLTYQAWFTSQYGEDAWNQLKYIRTNSWSDYLEWYSDVLQLPTENELKLTKIIPFPRYFELRFESKEGQKLFFAKKIVLATGMEGFGGAEIPYCFSKLSRKFLAHTSEVIHPEDLIGKRIAVIGCGASAFDASFLALQAGSKSVDMIVRRKSIPTQNKFVHFFHPGILYGFYDLPDTFRLMFFKEAVKYGVPPTKESVEKVKKFENFQIHLDACCYGVDIFDSTVKIMTAKGEFEVDFVVLATGYAVNGFRKQELQLFMDKILLWEEKMDVLLKDSKLAQYPYLGPHFQFIEKNSGDAPFLKNIYCFNYGARLSHGLITSSIPAISIGAMRLAEGIAKDFFLQEKELYFQKLKE